MVWEEQALWQKAKLFADRAFELDREESVFPLWAILAMELLARASLAHVHPALLADQRNGGNLLYAFGYGSESAPKSVPAKTVFSRCSKIVPHFTEREEKRCMALIERRNSELHSGELAFESFSTASWLAEYFMSCRVLVEFQGKTLEELFGPDEAAAAIEMIDNVAATVRDAVKQKIADAKAAFFDLAEGEQIARKNRDRPRHHLTNRAQECPACSNSATVSGKIVRADEPKTDGELLFRDIHVLPTMLACSACDLILRDHGELHAAGLGGQYTVSEDLDPVDHFGFYEEPDYGND